MEKVISIVIPCLNEERTLGICLKKASETLTKNNISGEIIVSDNGSDDNSIEIAKNFDNVKVVHCSQKGYGNALICGIKNACGKYVLMGDADNTYDFNEISNFLKAAQSDEHISMVMGSRFRGGIEKGAMPFLHKYIGNPFLTIITDILFFTNLTDSQCGMRLFKREDFEKINFTSTGMEFATEIIIEFLLNKFKIVEIPIKLYKDIPDRKPHLRTFRDGFRILKFILKKRFLDN